MSKPKFNLMDAFLILIIIAVIAGGALVLLRPAETVTQVQENITAQYVVELTGYDKVVADAFLQAKENDETLLVGERDRFEASIVSIAVEPTVRSILNEETETIDRVEDPLFYDITLTLESTAVEHDSKITVDNNQIRVGQAVAVKGKASAGYGYIIDLDLKN